MLVDLNGRGCAPGEIDLLAGKASEAQAYPPCEAVDSQALTEAGRKGDPRLKRPLSKRTGGPRTPGGVARASKNSITHGAYASLPPETFEFMAYLDRARQELCPSGVVEDSLAASIAHSAYKAQRLREIEMGRMVRLTCPLLAVPT